MLQDKERTNIFGRKVGIEIDNKDAKLIEIKKRNKTGLPFSYNQFSHLFIIVL